MAQPKSLRESGPYLLISKLGEGGMAEVFKAVKQGPDGFEKPVALKRILPHLADNESFIHMLSAEARLAAKLDHPNLVHVSDFFAHENTYLIALEYIAGHNLRRVMNDYSRTQKGTLPWQAAIHLVTETLKGLDFAHKRKGTDGKPLGIIHRDVSPQNVLISYDGLVKLSDFGIALANIERDKTESGVLKGKQRYLSPEQLESRTIDHRSDLFSAAVVLYEMICGVHPFEAPNDFETMKKIVRGEFRPSIEIRPELSGSIHQAISRTLLTDPNQRPADAAEFRSLLLKEQDPHWLQTGTEEVSKIMSTLYPKGAEQDEAPIERTPILSRTGTPLPFRIEPSQSLISGVAEVSLGKVQRKENPKKVRAPFWIAGGIALLAGFASVSFLLFRPKEEPLPPPRHAVVTPPPIPVEQAVVSPPNAVEAIEPLSPLEEEAPKRVKPSHVPPAPPALGELIIEGPKGASIFINGRPVGKLPFPTRNLKPGIYNVLVAMPNQRTPPKMTRAQIRPGSKTVVRWKQN